MTPERAAVVARVLVGLGGLLLVASIFWPWTATGLASTISGRELADLLLAGTVGRWVPRWAGVGLYAQPLCGGALLVGIGIGGRVGRVVVLAAASVALAMAVVIAGSLTWGPVEHPGGGAWLLGVGLLLAWSGIGLRAVTVTAGRGGAAAGTRRGGGHLDGDHPLDGDVDPG